MKGVLNQRSPLKWAGGKFSIMPQLREYLPKAACLIEPFVGGGSVFMNTDYDHYVLCDSNPALINFYQQLTTNTTKLMDRAWSLFKDGGSPSRSTPHHGDHVMTVIYIAGPMTGKPDFNRTAFTMTATRLRMQGHTVLNPATLPDGLRYRDYMLIGSAMLHCADVIYLLDGWEDSPGAKEEYATALKLNLIISTPESRKEAKSCF